MRILDITIHYLASNIIIIIIISSSSSSSSGSSSSSSGGDVNSGSNSSGSGSSSSGSGSSSSGGGGSSSGIPYHLHAQYLPIHTWNNVSRVYNFIASPWSQFIQHVKLFPMFNVLYFNVSTFRLIIIIIKVKAKSTLEQTTEAQRENRGIAVLFL